MGTGVAVVGGGIFGVSAAIELRRLGYPVTLFERRGVLLGGASRVNHRRLHRGYHYPRSSGTARAALQAAASFEAEYGAALLPGCRSYVAIAKTSSLIDVDAYLTFCDNLGLEYREEYPSFIKRAAVDVCLAVPEPHIDIRVLRRLCRRKLRAAEVDVRLNVQAEPEHLAGYDAVVMATYADLNDMRSAHPTATPLYKFQVCEVPVVTLPRAFRGSSVIVLDGPFVCFDPLDSSGRFVLGDVANNVHATSVGHRATVPRHLTRELRTGYVRRPRTSRFAAFVRSAEHFFHGAGAARHLGSMFGMRVVLPGHEATDARPTMVHRLDSRTVAIFSGKIVTCVAAAGDVARLLQAPEPAQLSRSSPARRS
jgi:FAD dependent oxidoreductase